MGRRYLHLLDWTPMLAALLGLLFLASILFLSQSPPQTLRGKCTKKYTTSELATVYWGCANRRTREQGQEISSWIDRWQPWSDLGIPSPRYPLDIEPLKDYSSWRARFSRDTRGAILFADSANTLQARFWLASGEVDLVLQELFPGVDKKERRGASESLAALAEPFSRNRGELIFSPESKRWQDLPARKIIQALEKKEIRTAQQQK